MNTRPSCIRLGIDVLHCVFCLPQGTDILETCKAENVEFLVYSGLENTTQMAGIPVAHFDAKGVVEEKIQVRTDANSVDNRPNI